MSTEPAVGSEFLSWANSAFLHCRDMKDFRALGSAAARNASKCRTLPCRFGITRSLNGPPLKGRQRCQLGAR
jgi:hypothetical protein